MAKQPNPAAAQTAAETETPSVIQAAWLRRQTAYAAYQALPEVNLPVVNGFGPGEREFWDELDAAEDEIRAAIAQSPGDHTPALVRIVPLLQFHSG